MLLASIAVVALSGAAMVNAGAIIGDGNVILGVSDTGHLNVPYNTQSFPGLPEEDPAMTPFGSPVGFVGLRSPDAKNTAVEQGFLGEGWGVGIRPGKPGTPFDDECSAQADGTMYINPQSFDVSNDLRTADSRVLCGVDENLHVRHQFRPAYRACKGAYTILVTIHNRLCFDVKDVIYRRVMDWDIDPTTFAELVTVSKPSSASIYEAASNNGFCEPQPSFVCLPLADAEGNDVGPPPYTALGPFDHGAHFDLNLGVLKGGEKVTFQLMYGYFPGKHGQLRAEECVERWFRSGVYSLGQDSADILTQNTFLFAVNGKMKKSQGICGLSIPRESTAQPSSAFAVAPGASSETSGGLTIEEKMAMNSGG